MTERKLYQRKWFAIVMLFVFWPLGIFLIYQQRHFSRQTTVLLLLISIIISVKAYDVGKYLFTYQIGDVLYTDTGTFTIQLLAEEKESVTSGPLKATVKTAFGFYGHETEPGLKATRVVLSEDHEGIYVELNIENTSEEDFLMWDLSKVTFETNTGDTGSNLTGELFSYNPRSFEANSKNVGVLHMYLESIDNIEWINFTLPAPVDRNLKEVGESVTLTVKF